MTLVELAKSMQQNDFVIKGKHYYTKPEQVEKGCKGCCFIDNPRCVSMGLTNVCCNYPVIFDKLPSTNHE